MPPTPDNRPLGPRVDTMLLLRHASAGDRIASPSLDRARRLDRSGREDARRLPQALAAHVLDRIVTSPHARCVQTVQPLAEARNLEIERRDELATDVSKSEVLALLAGISGSALACTHREVIELLFDGEVTCDKGGTWLLERRHRRWLPTAYVPPPGAKLVRGHPTLV